MTEIYKNDKIKGYEERHRFWTNQVLNQFGFSTNLFLTIGIAMIAYLIPTKKNYPKVKFDLCLQIHWGLTVYIVVVLLTFTSILAGSISVISRLYDLRLTRHLIWVRMKIFKKTTKFLNDDFIDLQLASLLNNFWHTLFRKIIFIQEIDTNDYDNLKVKFDALRKQSKLLGDLSWSAHKVQILFLILASIFYGLTFIFMN